MEQARKANQPTGSAAPDGTFAAGVNHVTELLPSFMNDIINAAPEEQKVRPIEWLLSNIASLEYSVADKRMAAMVNTFKLFKYHFLALRIVRVPNLRIHCFFR